MLVLELSGYNGVEFLANIDKEIPEADYTKFMEAIDLYLLKGLPIQHILGYSYFYGLKMIVNKDVLIPRSETEELVGYVLQKYDEVFDGKKVKVVDVGTGSGAIAIALQSEEPNFEMYATDISESALAVAKENASINHVNVNFMCGNMLEPLMNSGVKFDILVSNPPYICNNEYVEDIVKNNEPHIALFGGEDGMKFYDIILKDANKILNTPNIIAFEHSYSKGKEMLDLAHKYFPNGTSYVVKDLNGKDRMTFIINK